MKKTPLFFIAQQKAKGFTLIITISLLVLLTIIAVGMLSLSAITLRSSAQSDSMSIARSNARMALMLALGDLQRQMGPDDRISAPASLVKTTSPHGLTGVWQAWDPQETRTAAARDAKFQRWLVSSAKLSDVTNKANAPLVSADSTSAAVLLGNGSLGKRSTTVRDEQRIAVTPVPIAAKDRFGWVVIDESVKSRIDLFDSRAKTVGNNIARMGAPAVDAVSTLPGWNQFSPTEDEANKMVSLSSASLGGDVARDDVSVYYPDVTVYAQSLMTDVVNGGLKKDMSLLSARALSSAETSQRLYASTKAIDAASPSDPFLSLLTNYHQTYKRIGLRDGTVRPRADAVVAKLPTRYTPTNSAVSPMTVTRTLPTEPILVPSVVRVDTIFSMISRKTHGGWTSHYGTERPYLLHMQYLPIITLHNPYNVAIAFEGMKVTFKNMPVGFNFQVDGQPLSTSLVPLNQMYVSYAGSDTNSKDFGVTLKPANGSTSSTTLLLEPGQTKLFGTPRVTPGWTWFSESPGAGSDGINLFDWRSDKTTNFDLAPTMIMSAASSGAGFDIDWINPQPRQTAKGLEVAKGNTGMCGLKGNERLGVQFGPYAPPAGAGTFGLEIELIKGGAPVKAGGFLVKYGTAARLKEIFEKGRSVRFADTRSFPETYPKATIDPPITVTDIYEDGNRPIKDYINPKPFMIFSLAAKTTHESFLPAQTVLTGNPATNIAVIDLTPGKDPEGSAPLEMVMMPIRRGNAAIEENRAAEEGYFFSGNGSLRGTPRATFYELPSMPLQSLAQFRHANLANSGYMPYVTYTVGESMAHPMLSTTSTRGTWKDGSVMLDHTYLSNEALWDQYFLSTIADQSGSLFTPTRTYTKVMEDFFAGTAPLLNPRFSLYATTTTPPDDLKLTTAGNEAYKKIAASLLLDGGFNVNSTSVEAWKAVLASLEGSTVETVLGAEASATEQAPVLRVRRPAAKSTDAAVLQTIQQRNQGYRTLNRGQTEALAREIVAEVRLRGPFLSLSDFVNRGLGAASDARNLKGAIQAAIDRTDINTRAKLDGKELAIADLASNGYTSAEAGVGNSAAHGPGFVTQGDVLSHIGSRITARADTFRVRAYGDARDASGKLLARAWCEAVVQRVPDFVDNSQLATAQVADLNPINRTFGRKFKMVMFRWLQASEV